MDQFEQSKQAAKIRVVGVGVPGCLPRRLREGDHRVAVLVRVARELLRAQLAIAPAPVKGMLEHVDLGPRLIE